MLRLCCCSAGAGGRAGGARGTAWAAGAMVRGQSSAPALSAGHVLAVARGALRGPVTRMRVMATKAAGVGAGPVPYRAQGVWLMGVAGLVGGMVVVGGLTRLTRSGLSMTDWKLQGGLPPMNAEEWEAEFERYKQFPEYTQRRSMTLEEFKGIFWWEYGHRMLGRVIGLAFVAPLAYFGLRGRIPPGFAPKLGVLLGLGGAQGLIGWWMVKSGLDVDPNKTRREIRVSPYRLATHLGMAFTTFGLLLWNGISLLQPPQQAEALGRMASMLSPNTIAKMGRLRQLAGISLLLSACTAMSGAFVAGNDAGRAYNMFPKMTDDAYIPDEILELEPTWRNFFENTATVQFDHRVLGLSTLTAILGTLGYARFAGGLWTSLPASTRFSLLSMGLVSATQVTLGISTLLLYVPIPLAAAHQTGALALLGTATWAMHTMRFAPVAARAAGAASKVAQKIVR